MIAVTLRDANRAFWIREQSRVDDIIVQVKIIKYTRAGNVVRQTANL